MRVGRIEFRKYIDAVQWQFVHEIQRAGHLRRDDDGVIASLTRGQKIRGAIALTKRLNEFSRHVASDVQCLCRTKPGSSSDVARHTPSGNCST